MRSIIAGLLFAAGCAGSPVEPPVDISFANPERIVVRGYDGDAMEPFVTADGRWLLFNNSNDPRVDTNLQIAERVDELTFVWRGELRDANSAALDGVPSVERDGSLYFISTRDYEQTLNTLFRAKLAGERATGVEAVEGISRRERGWVVFDAEVSADGQTIWFADGRFAGGAVPEEADLFIGRRNGAGFTRDPDSARILAAINTPALEYAPTVSSDGLELVFTRLVNRSPAILRATRRSMDEPFGAPKRIGDLSGFVEAPALSPGDASLYYHRKDGGRFAIERVMRTH